jgi:hypothetical protein
MLPVQHDHITNQEWLAFRRRNLSNEQLSRMADYLKSCETCRRLQRLSANAGAGARPELPELATEPAGGSLHLTYEQLSAYLDAASSGRPGWSDVEAHLAFCRTCAAEYADLLAFDANRPVAAAKPEPGFWAAIRDFFATPRSPAFTGAAAALAMAGVAILMFGSAASLPGSGPDAVSPASELYRAQQMLDLRSIAGGLLAALGAAGLAYRFVSSRSSAGKR